jgi:hypothetical protein
LSGVCDLVGDARRRQHHRRPQIAEPPLKLVISAGPAIEAAPIATVAKNRLRISISLGIGGCDQAATPLWR